MSERKRASLFDDADEKPISEAGEPRLKLDRFQPKPSQSVVDEKTVAVVSEASGFTTKHAKRPKKVDGRSLKKSARTHQFNVRLKPRNAERFWTGAQDAGFTYADDFLEHLLDQYEGRGQG